MSGITVPLERSSSGVNSTLETNRTLCVTCNQKTTTFKSECTQKVRICRLRNSKTPPGHSPLKVSAPHSSTHTSCLQDTAPNKHSKTTQFPEIQGNHHTAGAAHRPAARTHGDHITEGMSSHFKDHGHCCPHFISPPLTATELATMATRVGPTSGPAAATCRHAGRPALFIHQWKQENPIFLKVHCLTPVH